MKGNVKALARENAHLRQQNAELERQKTELAKRVDILDEQIAWFKSRFFGRSSESLNEEEKRQLRLFDEAELSLKEAEGQDQQPPVRIAEHTRARPKRLRLPAALPRVEVLIDISESDKHCLCGAELKRIGEEASKKLDVIPPRLQVIRTIRPKYACHLCEGSGDVKRPAVRIAPIPPALIDKGTASAGWWRIS